MIQCTIINYELRKVLQHYCPMCRDSTAVETSRFHDLCATVSTISRSFVSIGRKKHATAASKAANPYTDVANVRDDCMRTYRKKKNHFQCAVPFPPNLRRFDDLNNIWHSSPSCNFLHPCHFLPLKSKYSPCHILKLVQTLFL